ncbi:methyltransferase domain-containing protein [Ramlibacter ginsenosidimutans]|uniref:Methyltransferase domain-containing protein n=1 Tax=Ramlibacter ginsenosidimutans TaxID=502333 RepID=A0A934TQU2_9BURK|nr:class I SAM-dependent methyltransferase [Ramlibacter ginsenosidimutans]MBK6005768.1 methyltransferase domain-containing protein [Ramlibacter ginsenosidimutans]
MNLKRPLGTRLRHVLVVTLRPRGKLAFLRSLPPGAHVLDVGCGNNSPRDAKILRPDLVYHGLDVSDYNQGDSLRYADTYKVVASADFAGAIRHFEGQVDAVVSSHNLEHCEDPDGVLKAMAAALRPGGCLYLAFPCEASVRFPRRRGTLNFFDDNTHREVPSWSAVVSELIASGLQTDIACPRYRPFVLATMGLLLEPASWLAGRNLPGATWALYGFESIIWGSQPMAKG